jgi:hypothetical protein
MTKTKETIPERINIAYVILGFMYLFSLSSLGSCFYFNLPGYAIFLLVVIGLGLLALSVGLHWLLVETVKEIWDGYN